MKFATKPVR